MDVVCVVLFCSCLPPTTVFVFCVLREDWAGVRSVFQLQRLRTGTIYDGINISRFSRCAYYMIVWLGAVLCTTY